MRASKFYGMIVKIKNRIILFTVLAKNNSMYCTPLSKLILPLFSKYDQYIDINILIPKLCDCNEKLLVKTNTNNKDAFISILNVIKFVFYGTAKLFNSK